MYVSRKSLKAVSGPLRAARMKEHFATGVPDRKYFSIICFYLFLFVFLSRRSGCCGFCYTVARGIVGNNTQGFWGREPPGREGEARPATRSNRFVPLATMRSLLSGTDCDKPRKPLINSFFLNDVARGSPPGTAFADGWARPAVGGDGTASVLVVMRFTG
jgi:hypothetical protein